MRKKTILATLSILLLLLIGGSILFSFKNSPKCGLLNINGIDITKKNVMIRSGYAELPLTEVMKNLGMKVDWVDKSTAEIIFKGKTYTLNLSKISLIEDGQDSNLLVSPPGGRRTYTVLEKELILDSNTIKSAMYLMGIQINIEINHKEQIIYISEKRD